ncbi:hypothetical protein ZWY2020_015699 [Hordeum vulgare]|nr:hypothetical protein ZWY2020_015699 [Hordeum vulgare]
MVLEGYGNEADKFNGGRSTGQGQQHGGRPLDFEAAVLDPYTHYKLNLCNHTDYATSLTDAIAKILDPVSALSAIDEVRKFRECQGRYVLKKMKGKREI